MPEFEEVNHEVSTRFHQLSGVRYSTVGTGAGRGIVEALALSWTPQTLKIVSTLALSWPIPGAVKEVATIILAIPYPAPDC
jgi:hypothetical protein